MLTWLQIGSVTIMFLAYAVVFLAYEIRKCWRRDLTIYTDQIERLADRCAVLRRDICEDAKSYKEIIKDRESRLERMIAEGGERVNRLVALQNEIKECDSDREHWKSRYAELEARCNKMSDKYHSAVHALINIRHEAKEFKEYLDNSQFLAGVREKAGPLLVACDKTEGAA